MKQFLLVVDMQKDFVDGSLGTPEAVAIVPAESGSRPEGLRPARGVAASGFPPLRKIPHCCLP